MTKQIRNKFYSLIVAAFAIFALTISTFAAGSCRIEFSDLQTTRGKNVTVALKVKASDVRLQKADITVNYDQNAMEFVKGTNAEGGAGTVRVNGTGKTSQSKTLSYDLEFKMLTAGTHYISVLNNEIYDVNDQVVAVTKIGQSKIVTKPSKTSSNNAKLSKLVALPGALNPEFSADVLEYTIEVPQDVDSLSLTAVTEDADATTQISGNQEFKVGPNPVVISVTAGDNVTKRTYNINVNKLDVGQSGTTILSNDGDKIQTKSHIYTILAIPEGDEAPYGMEKKRISSVGVNEFDAFAVIGNSDPEYCIIYAMSDAGDVGYYKYDRSASEATIQRYFVDPATDIVNMMTIENANLKTLTNDLKSKNKIYLIAIAVLGILAVVFLILFLTKPSKKSRKQDDDFEDFNDNEYDKYGKDNKDKEVEDDNDFEFIQKNRERNFDNELEINDTNDYNSNQNDIETQYNDNSEQEVIDLD